jgi:hypothetical protein
MAGRSDGATARMASEIFVTNKVAVVSNYVDRVIDDRVPIKRIAMFIIPVNSERPTSSGFTGFELKASTNNFSHATGISEETRLQFYAQSELADVGADYGWDKMKMYVCTGYDSWDVRAYTKIENTVDWGHELRNVVVLVDKTCIVKNQGDWLREDNEDLMWCYLRNMNNDVEQEDGSTKTLWHPIAPVRWFSELPNWAVQ